MRKLVPLLFLFALVPSPAMAAKASTCTVVPDPVPIGSSDLQYYTITATGGTPLELYEVLVQQAGHTATDEASTVARIYADDTGTVSGQVGYWDGRIVGEGTVSALWLGTANVKIRRSASGGGPGGGQRGAISTCSFTVVG